MEPLFIGYCPICNFEAAGNNYINELRMLGHEEYSTVPKTVPSLCLLHLRELAYWWTRKNDREDRPISTLDVAHWSQHRLLRYVQGQVETAYEKRKRILKECLDEIKQRDENGKETNRSKSCAII